MNQFPSRTSQYLQLQNTRLKQQIQDLKDMIRVNKQSINILSQSHPTRPTHSHTPSLDLSNPNPLKPQSHQLKDIIKLLNSKNSQIMDEVFKLHRQNQELRAKLLLLEQITEGYEDQQKRNIQMVESQLKSLSRNLLFANEKLSENEKHKFHVDNISGLAIKMKEIYNPTEQAMMFKEVEFKLREECVIRKLECERMKEEKMNLKKLNMSLENELIKMKTALLMPNKPLDKVGEAAIKKLALYFLEAQRKVLEGEDSDQQLEDIEIMAPELVILFPEKVEAYKKKKETKKVSIPKLDLGKVRELMNYNKKFVEAELKRRNNVPKTERIRLLEEQLEFTRRELTRSILLLKEEQSKNSNLERKFIQLQNRHRLIEKSYQNMSKKATSKSRNQFKKPDLNQTFNAFMFQKNSSPSYLANFKPAMQTKETHNTNNEEMVTVEEYRMQIYGLSEEICSLPYFNNNNGKGTSLKNQLQAPKLARSSSNPTLPTAVPLKDPVNANIVLNPHHPPHPINRYEENLDNIQI